MDIHIHSGGIVGGFSVCGSRTGNLVNDADKANCINCITKVREWVKQTPSHPYEDEVKRACSNIGIEF